MFERISMFTRFSDAARDIVGEAQAQARRLHHGWVGCEHLLLALTQSPSNVADAFAGHGITTTRVEHAISDIRASMLDADALASIGIDLDEVRACAEATFGVGALDRTTRRERRWWRRRTDPSGVASPTDSASAESRLPFTRPAKRCLKTATTLSQGHVVDSRHVAAAVVSRADALAGDIFRRLGADVGELQAALGKLPRRNL